MTTSDTTNLVLQVRLESLRRSLERVSRVKEALEKQQEGLDQLKALLDGNSPLRVAAREISVDLPGWITKLYDAHHIPDDINLDPTKQRLIDQAPTIMTDLQKAEKILDAIPTTPIDEDILNGLVKPAKSLAIKIQTAVEQLEGGRGQPPNKQDPAPDAVALAWATVWTNRTMILDVFSEYVDLLGGLALRSGGFGRNACELGDELVGNLATSSKVWWSSLTIPASTEKSSKTLADIIRLGFPEWTIWALPLAAYGFGYVVIENRPQWNVGPLGGDPQGSAHLNTLLADVFATYSLGPAYVCAALLLRLNPFAAEPGGVPSADRIRAAVLLATLEWMNAGQGDDGGPFDDVITHLRQEWNAAIAQVTDAIELHVTGNQSPIPAVPAEPIEEATLRRWVAKACGLVDQLGSVRYERERWEERQDWPQKLIASEKWKPSPVKTRLSDVLNAAWIARLEHPEAAEVIESAANRVIDEIRVTGSLRRRAEVNRRRVTGDS